MQKPGSTGEMDAPPQQTKTPIKEEQEDIGMQKQVKVKPENEKDDIQRRQLILSQVKNPSLHHDNTEEGRDPIRQELRVDIKPEIKTEYSTQRQTTSGQNENLPFHLGDVKAEKEEPNFGPNITRRLKNRKSETGNVNNNNIQYISQPTLLQNGNLPVLPKTSNTTFIPHISPPKKTIEKKQIRKPFIPSLDSRGKICQRCFEKFPLEENHRLEFPKKYEWKTDLTDRQKRWLIEKIGLNPVEFELGPNHKCENIFPTSDWKVLGSEPNIVRLVPQRELNSFIQPHANSVANRPNFSQITGNMVVPTIGFSVKPQPVSTINTLNNHYYQDQGVNTFYYHQQSLPPPGWRINPAPSDTVKIIPNYPIGANQANLYSHQQSTATYGPGFNNYTAPFHGNLGNTTSNIQLQPGGERVYPINGNQINYSDPSVNQTNFHQQGSNFSGPIIQPQNGHIVASNNGYTASNLAWSLNSSANQTHFGSTFSDPIVQPQSGPIPIGYATSNMGLNPGENRSYFYQQNPQFFGSNVQKGPPDLNSSTKGYLQLPQGQTLDWWYGPRNPPLNLSNTLPQSNVVVGSNMHGQNGPTLAASIGRGTNNLGFNPANSHQLVENNIFGLNPANGQLQPTPGLVVGSNNYSQLQNGQIRDPHFRRGNLTLDTGVGQSFPQQHNSLIQGANVPRALSLNDSAALRQFPGEFRPNYAQNQGVSQRQPNNHTVQGTDVHRALSFNDSTALGQFPGEFRPNYAQNQGISQGQPNNNTDQNGTMTTSFYTYLSF